MPRIFLPLADLSGTIRITGEKAHYLASVLRCQKGEEVQLLDGKGNACRATIKEIGKRTVLAEVGEVTHARPDSPFHLILIQGVLKGERMDLVIQKTTELGVREIIPAVTERSQVRDTKKVDRWRKIAEDASRQSGRTVIPVIHKLIPFEDILSPMPERIARSREYGGLLFWENDGMHLGEALDRFRDPPLSLMVGIGPEGGFTREEVARAESKGFIVTSLGRRILRAETAAITAAALLQFLLGDLG